MTVIYKDRRPILIWLALCITLVVLMVLVGGYTRLSGSGLSITEWKPIHGTLPPMGAHEWEEEFEAYKQSPQYQKINKGMSFEEFQAIYWPEYFHRLLGRLIGLVFLVPLIIFALRRSFSKCFGWRLTAIFALGGVQGLMGWLMVASGLVDNPHVSHLRLAAHLMLAFALFGLLVWALMQVAGPQTLVSSKGKILATGDWRLKTYLGWFTLLCFQIVLGAMLAGLHGGLVYNTWPTMNGQWISEDIFMQNPGITENIPLIQFLHRTVAVLVAFGFLLWWHRGREYVKNKRLGKGCAGVTAIIAFQFLLGVLTLLHHVPLPLALAHQMTGLLLFGASVVLLYKLRHCEECSDEAIQTGSPRGYAARDDGKK